MTKENKFKIGLCLQEIALSMDDATLERNRERLKLIEDIIAGEQEQCEDCISREKAKQFLYERLDRLNDDELYDIFSRIIDDMYNELPSVNPTSNVSIQITEREKYGRFN